MEPAQPLAEPPERFVIVKGYLYYVYPLAKETPLRYQLGKPVGGGGGWSRSWVDKHDTVAVVVGRESALALRDRLRALKDAEDDAVSEVRTRYRVLRAGTITEFAEVTNG